MLVRMIRITTRFQNVNYYMATMVRAFWLAAKLAKVSCNDRALFATCLRHIQCLFNLIVGIHVMSNWQLSKSYPLTSVTWLYRGLKCTSNWGGVFFKLSTDQLLVLIDRRLNYFRFFFINSTKKAANNLLISSIRSLQGFPCNDLTPSL